MGTVDRLSGPQRSRCDRYECGYKQLSAAAQLKHCSPEYRLEQDCPLSQRLTAGLRAANAYALLVDFHRNYSMHSLNGEVSGWTTDGNSNLSNVLLVRRNQTYKACPNSSCWAKGRLFKSEQPKVANLGLIAAEKPSRIQRT